MVLASPAAPQAASFTQIEPKKTSVSLVFEVKSDQSLAAPSIQKHSQSQHAPPSLRQTNDDAVTVTTQPVIMDIVGKHSNPNGCNIPAT